MRHSGMPHFEVHTLAQRRWLIDGIFFDKATAIDDAKLLLGRTQALDAVRVLQVEEERSGFFETTVYIATRPPEQRRRVAEAPAPASLPTLGALSPAGAAVALRRPARGLSDQAPMLALVTVLALCGLMIHFAHRASDPNWVWVFDRPEAWQQHELHSPWTGETPR